MKRIVEIEGCLDCPLFEELWNNRKLFLFQCHDTRKIITIDGFNDILFWDDVCKFTDTWFKNCTKWKEKEEEKD